MIIFEKSIKGVREPDLVRFARRAQRLARASGEVDVLIAGDRHLQQLNRQFRGKNKATDVLSFPRQGDVNAGGDIAISADYARRSARRYGHSHGDELKILILHGMLHLAGHDHESDNGTMARLEATLRRRLKLPGSLIERAAPLPGPNDRSRGARATRHARPTKSGRSR